MANTNIGIPCKKITSENSLQKALSKAVKQIEINGFEFGTVAINIDDLLPEHTILKMAMSGLKVGIPSLSWPSAPVTALV